MKRIAMLATAAAALAALGFAAPGQAATGDAHGAGGDLPQEVVKHAVQAVQNADLDHHFVVLMQHAKGVFIVPAYRSKLLGGSEREGVLLAPERNSWTDPAFFSIRAMSGAAKQNGKPAPVIMLLMTDRALHDFATAHDLSLRHSGLSVVKTSPKVKVGTRTDVVVWSGGHTAQGGIRVSGISPDIRTDHHYYGQNVDTAQILKGETNNLSAGKLRNALRA